MKTELAVASGPALFRCPRCGHEETQAAASEVWHLCTKREAGRRESVQMRKVQR